MRVSLLCGSVLHAALLTDCVVCAVTFDLKMMMMKMKIERASCWKLARARFQSKNERIGLLGNVGSCRNN